MALSLMFLGRLPVPDALAAGTALTISPVPLTVTMPSHPQVLIAIGNSQSMDGDLSGAIMTGSGVLPSALSSLTVPNPSPVNYCAPPSGFLTPASPVEFCVPSGFTPPVQAADASGQAPYTVNQSGTLLDNSASRLNVAKAGISAILNAYMQNTNFALEEYSTSNTSLYDTWVYYMSPSNGGFEFTSTQVAGSRYVANPCYGYLSASSGVNSNCSAMAAWYGSTTLNGDPYMQIGSSSDDASINDVLYASFGSSLALYANAGPSPTNPYSAYSLSQYNNNQVQVGYGSGVPCCNYPTSPTNAGFVPYSPQVMYVRRGFGYYSGVSSGSGNIVVPMQSAGTSPTPSSVSTAISAFTPYLAPETNQLSTSEIKALAVQSPLAGLLTEAKSYLGDLPSSVDSGCSSQKYVILISDGLPTMDLDGKSWPPVGSAAAAGYGMTAAFNSDGSLNFGATNDQALKDAVTAIQNLKEAGINTYVVGLGAGVDPTQNPQAAATLTAMAIAGGTTNYYPATSPTALVQDLDTILNSIQAGTYTTASAAVNSTELSAGNVSYQASFTSNDTPYQDWTGNFYAANVTISVSATGTTTTVSQLWSAQTQLDTAASTSSGWPAPPSRLIATWNPVMAAASGATGSGVPFEWPTTSTPTLSSTQQADLQPTDSLGASRLQYLRGSSAQEQRNGGTFRNRSHLLGDIVDSQPLYVGPPAGPYFTSSYLSFETTWASRPPVLYVGANDGMLHAFDAGTGDERFAFIPNAVFANLINLTQPVYNQSHLFYVDGSPSSADVQFSNGTWHTVLVGGENAGGNSIYALDVTDPAGNTTEAALAANVLWEFTDGDMGLSYSQPQIAPIAVPPSSSASLSYAVFFGNGYNSPNNNAVLYALDPKTGTVIQKINLCAAVSPSPCNTSLPEGLSTVAVANSGGIVDAPITTVYAGDLQGNLWAVDVSNATPANWTARVLFEARDASNNPQPITTPPVVTLNPNYPVSAGLFVMVGTGQLLTNPDLTNTQTQSIYGVWDKPGSTTTYTRANLQAQTLKYVSPNPPTYPQSLLTDSANSVNWSTQVGWYADLPVAGQRVVVNMQLSLGSLLGTLNTPPASLCGGSFSSMFFDINYQNGGQFSLPQLDITNTGSFTSYESFNPVGIGLPTGFGVAPTLLAPSLTRVGATGGGATGTCGGVSCAFGYFPTVPGASSGGSSGSGGEGGDGGSGSGSGSGSGGGSGTTSGPAGVSTPYRYTRIPRASWWQIQ
ncbi:putative type 4 fimbrial biogenesis protein PilY1 [Burkholderiales bacterium GJ-E10]|nr:putative type 4 fimbrial biogenesis protein PilY1 [Burkholderiales bacterium GJ-E10]